MHQNQATNLPALPLCTCPVSPHWLLKSTMQCQEIGKRNEILPTEIRGYALPWLFCAGLVASNDTRDPMYLIPYSQSFLIGCKLLYIGAECSLCARSACCLVWWMKRYTTLLGSNTDREAAKYDFYSCPRLGWFPSSPYVFCCLTSTNVSNC